jgi:CubicO group peptidase (beta-lactamase class C family)
MRRLAILFLFVAQFVFAGDDPVAAADAYLKKTYPADQPGAAVLIVHNGKTVLLNGYGLADLEAKMPITPDTAFDLASVSKQFTAMAVMLLAERGKLSYDDDVVRWIPDLPVFDGPRPLKLRDLLNQTSGLPDYLGIFKGSDEEFAKLTCADVPRLLAGKKLRFPPGTEFKYSNTNYALLPLVVERASGKTFSRFMHDHVFAPLGMTSTLVADAVPYNIPNRATGYNKKLLSTKFTISRKDGPICGDGNVFTTARDLAKWDQALSNVKLVRPATLAEAWTPPKLPDDKKTDYGFGWVVQTKNGKTTVWHNGGWSGTHTMIGRKLDDKLTVVVLCNDEGSTPEKTAMEIGKLFNPDPKPNTPPKERQPSAHHSW